MDSMKLLKSAVKDAKQADVTDSAPASLAFAVTALAWTAIAVAYWLVTGQAVEIPDEDGA